MSEKELPWWRLRNRLPLPLLVPRIGTDDKHAPFAPDDFAVFANPFDACPHFHLRHPVRL